MSGLKQPLAEAMPDLARYGIPNVVAAVELGVGVQATASITLTGANQAITFAQLVSQTNGPIKAPLDTDYIVLVTGASTAQVDLSTRTRSGFTLVGGANTNVIAFVIISRFGAMTR